MNAARNRTTDAISQVAAGVKAAVAAGRAAYKSLGDKPEPERTAAAVSAGLATLTEESVGPLSNSETFIQVARKILAKSVGDDHEFEFEVVVSKMPGSEADAAKFETLKRIARRVAAVEMPPNFGSMLRQGSGAAEVDDETAEDVEAVASELSELLLRDAVAACCRDGLSLVANIDVDSILTLAYRLAWGQAILSTHMREYVQSFNAAVDKTLTDADTFMNVMNGDTPAPTDSKGDEPQCAGNACDTTSPGDEHC